MNANKNNANKNSKDTGGARPRATAGLQASGIPVAAPTILNGTTKIDITNRNWLPNPT